MPETSVVDQKLAAKSLVRHRPLETQGGERGERETSASPSFQPTVQRASRPIRPESPTPTSATPKTSTSKRVSQAPSMPRPSVISSAVPISRISASPQPLRRTKTQNAPTNRLRHQSIPHAHVSAPSPHPLLLLGLGMLMMLLLWTLITAVVGWIGTTLDDLHYGRPRTSQVDAYVGHNERPGHPSHFIVVNLHGHIDILELQGDDPAHTHMYVGPTLTGPNSDLTPATLRFIAVQGQKYPNMLLVVGSSQVLYLNTGGVFVMSPR